MFAKFGVHPGEVLLGDLDVELALLSWGRPRPRPYDNGVTTPEEIHAR